MTKHHLDTSFLELIGKRRLFLHDSHNSVSLSTLNRFIIKRLDQMEIEVEDKDKIHLKLEAIREMLKKIDTNVSIIGRQNLGENSYFETV
jgi:hypothetical protein